MQADVKTKNRKKLKVKVLVDSRCIYTGIDEQLVKDKRIQSKPINFSFKVFNADRTKNGQVTRVVSSSQIVDLVFLYFIFYFHFIFILFFYF